MLVLCEEYLRDDSPCIRVMRAVSMLCKPRSESIELGRPPTPSSHVLQRRWPGKSSDELPKFGTTGFGGALMPTADRRVLTTSVTASEFRRLKPANEGFRRAPSGTDVSMLESDDRLAADAVVLRRVNTGSSGSRAADTVPHDGRRMFDQLASMFDHWSVGVLHGTDVQVRPPSCPASILPRPPTREVVEARRELESTTEARRLADSADDDLRRLACSVGGLAVAFPDREEVKRVHTETREFDEVRRVPPVPRSRPDSADEERRNAESADEVLKRRGAFFACFLAAGPEAELRAEAVMRVHRCSGPEGCRVRFLRTCGLLGLVLTRRSGRTASARSRKLSDPASPILSPRLCRKTVLKSWSDAGGGGWYSSEITESCGFSKSVGRFSKDAETENES